MNNRRIGTVRNEQTAEKLKKALEKTFTYLSFYYVPYNHIFMMYVCPVKDDDTVSQGELSTIRRAVDVVFFFVEEQ